MAMLRFSIRDLLWLTLVVGLLVGWRIHYLHMRRRADDALANEARLRKDHEFTRAFNDALWKRVERDRQEIERLMDEDDTEKLKRWSEWLNQIKQSRASQ